MENEEFDLDAEFAEYQNELKALHSEIDNIGKQLDKLEKEVKQIYQEKYGFITSTMEEQEIRGSSMNLDE